MRGLDPITRVKKIITRGSYKPWYEKGKYTAHYTNGKGLVDYQDAVKYCEQLPDIHMFMHDSGMCATHNMPCPICKTNHAVFITGDGVFGVCHDCKKLGWFVGKKPTPRPKKFWEFWKSK